MTLYKPESLLDYTRIEHAGKKVARAMFWFVVLTLLAAWPLNRLLRFTGGDLRGWKLLVVSSLIILVIFNLVCRGWPVSWIREWRRKNSPGYRLIMVPRKDGDFDYRVCTPDSFREWKYVGYRDSYVAFDKGENGYLVIDLSGEWFGYAGLRCRLVKGGHHPNDLEIEVVTASGEKFHFSPKELFDFEKLEARSVGNMVRKICFLNEHSDQLYDEKSRLEEKFEDALHILVEIHTRLEETKRLKRSEEGAAIRRYLGEQIVSLLPRSTCTFWDQYADLKRRYGKKEAGEKSA